MKKKVVLLSCVFVLVSVLSANAGLVIVANIGDGVWANYPDSKLIISPSQTLLIGILDLSGGIRQGSLALGLNNGLGSLDISNIVTFQGVTAMTKDDAAAATALGIENPFISLQINGSTTPGMLVSQIAFHCEGPGDVTVYAIGDGGLIADSQVIHQIPEPATLAILGLGGLLLRRRSA